MTKDNSQKTATLIRIRRVMGKTGVSKSQIYRLAQMGEFPLPVKLTAQSVAWVEQEVDHWIEQRIANRDNAKGGAI